VGEEFQVGDDRFTLHSISSFTDAVITRVSDGVLIPISDRRGVEVAPNVVLSVGSRSQLALARIAITAPRNLAISRPTQDRQEGPT
jgi:hypothetical protein